MPTRNTLAGASLGNISFVPATFQGNTFTPQQADMNLLARSLDKIEQREIATSQQRGAIAKALADVELNEAEDEWKANYANKIQDEINSLISIGDYSNALNRAAVLAGKSLADPALRGRVRAQQEYKTFVDNTLARKDLTEDDKSWAIAMNPYKYEDKFDDRGNVVGGTNWKPTTRPVGEIDYNKLLATAKQLVFQESGGGTQVVFYDSEGKDTTNPLIAEGVKYYKNGQWQGINKKKLNQLLEAAIDNEPGARARIEQDWQVANWKYDQLSEKEKAISKPSELFASNGRKYTKEEWYNNKFGRALDAMSGMNYSSSIKYDDDYSKFMTARRAGLGVNNNDPFGGQNIITTKGNPAQLETEDTVNKAFGKVVSGVQDIEKIIPGYLKNTKRWIEAKKNNDYNTIANLALMHIRTHDIENKPAIESKIRELRSNASLINSVKQKGGDFDAIAFNGAFTTGGELPANNPYTKEFLNRYEYFGGKNAIKLRYSFEDNQELKNFINTLGLTREDYRTVNTENGLPAIVIDKNNTKNYRAIELYDNLGYQGRQTSIINDIKQNGLLRGLTRFRRTGINGIDENGSIIESRKPFIGSNVDASSWLGLRGPQSVDIRNIPDYRQLNLLDIANVAKSKAKQAVGDMASNIVTVTTKNFELPRVAAARIKYAGEPSSMNSEINNAVDEAVNALFSMHGSQYEIMFADDETELLKSANIKDRVEILKEVQDYITENRSAAKDLIGTKNIDGKYGYRIRIPRDWNKSKNKYIEGDITPTEIVIFSPDDPILSKMERDTKSIATTRYDRLSRVEGATHITFDDNEVKFVNGYPIMNGRPTTREKAIKELTKDEGYSQLKDSFLNNITNSGGLTPEYANTLATYVRNEFGYNIGTPANIAKATEIINQIQNELK